MQGYPTSPDPQQSPQPQPSQPMPQQNPPAYGPPPFAPVSAPGAPNAPQSNRKKLLIGGGLGCGVLLILCMCVGLMGAIASQGNSSASSGGSPTATTAQQPVATPTSTPNVNASAPAYANIVSRDGTMLSDDLNQVGSNCGSSQDLAKCRSALVTVHQDSETFLSDLDGQPTPPCMSSVDRPLRAALHDIDAAAQEIIDGIDNYDVTKINNGTTLMSKATTEIDTASSELDNVSCS